MKRVKFYQDLKIYPLVRKIDWENLCVVTNQDIIVDRKQHKTIIGRSDIWRSSMVYCMPCIRRSFAEQTQCCMTEDFSEKLLVDLDFIIRQTNR